MSAREAVTAGQKSIEHLTGILLACSSREDDLRAQELTALASRDYAGLPETWRQAMATYDQTKARAFFMQTAQSSTWQVPTLVWTQATVELTTRIWSVIRGSSMFRFRCVKVEPREAPKRVLRLRNWQN